MLGLWIHTPVPDVMTKRNVTPLLCSVLQSAPGSILGSILLPGQERGDGWWLLPPASPHHLRGSEGGQKVVWNRPEQIVVIRLVRAEG